MGQPHKHAAVIKAWADGADIQFKSPTSLGWMTASAGCSSLGFFENYEYRIRPKTIFYRKYLHRTSYGVIIVGCAHDQIDVISIEQRVGFIKWIGYWEEVEVTE